MPVVILSRAGLQLNGMIISLLSHERRLRQGFRANLVEDPSDLSGLSIHFIFKVLVR
jgi:hypothetical protein